MRIPHLAIPFELDRRGSARTVDQDTDGDVIQCVRALVESRPGDRQMVPRYGVDDLTFAPADAIGEDWVADVAAEFEPRATVNTTQRAVDGSGRTQITVEVGT